ncbi:ATP-grasp domain-containing protein [Ophiocordyceps camponoti-floridani]|uniref:ATP-grasp domain-containing protein n=1 Tax=Ophiocordyceps camponoti-floridani TaxID=2030778 RepID=A0A8H4Q780_9HYPO|nr:ATP-grasp domain-containing protein [Ophiocordyceps camponoti-floridani]
MAPPIIEFDATLKDLYQLDSGKLYANFTHPFGQVQYSRGLPTSSKYTFQDPRNNSENVEAARIFIHVVAQFFTMVAGAINVVMFDIDMPGLTQGPDLQARADTEAVLGQIARQQKPYVKHVQKSSEILLPPDAIISSVGPIDCLEHLPSLVSFDAHYRALSKRELALSGVPTPRTDVIDTILDALQVQDPQLRAAEVRRMLEPVEQKPVPFVVKLPQSSAGRGTFIVRNQHDRYETVNELGVEVDRMLCKLTDANTHLRPVCLLVQEMVAGSALAISMFVSKAGDALVTSCCDQEIGPQGSYSGGHIDYSQQPRLKDEYTPIANQVAAYMHRLGYHGPIGFDAMTGPQGEHLVIDMNARVTGSFALGLLKGFFRTARGFNNVSVMIQMSLIIGLDEFRSRFSDEIDEGRLVIGGWCRKTTRKSCMAVILVAGEEQESMVALAKRIKALDKPDPSDEPLNEDI